MFESRDSDISPSRRTPAENVQPSDWNTLVALLDFIVHPASRQRDTICFNGTSLCVNRQLVFGFGNNERISLERRRERCSF